MARRTALACFVAVLACAVTVQCATSPTALARDAVAAMQSTYFDAATGSYGCTWALEASKRDGSDGGSGVGWWNCANSVTALADFVLVQPSAPSTPSYRATLSSIYNKTELVYAVAVLTDGSNDDQGWSLATGHTAYVSRTQGYFKHVSTDWDDTCGGGVWWSSKKGYKNAITNELFLMTAARLYQVTGDAQYLAWARKEWAWFNASGMIDSRFLINDGLTSSCKNNGGTTWTYNQGVILGALVHLWQAEAQAAGTTPSGESPYLRMVAALANASTTLLVDDNGILVEPCESSCDSDQTQFKGIFVRYLAYAIHQVDATTGGALPAWWVPYRRQFVQFLDTNGAAVASNDVSHTNGQSLYGLQWDGPPGVEQGVQTQTSAVDLFNAIVQVA